MPKPFLTVMHVISNLNDGGAEAALYRLCVNAVRYRHVVVCMMNEGKYGPLLTAAGISVHYLNMPQSTITLKGVKELFRLLRVQRPDLVQTWMYHADLIGGVVARLSLVSKVYWGVHHSNLSPGTVKRSTIWVAKLCARLSRWVPTRIVSCSQQSVTIHTALGYDASRFTVISNGYDLSLYVPDLAGRKRLRLDWGIAPYTLLLGFVARFDAQKDHANLFAALGHLKRVGINFHCMLVGTGMDATNTQLMEWLQREGVADQVTLLGRRNDIPEVMSALDVHVLSSLGEAFPNVLAEAMACGTPCVTTDVGDAAYIVGDTGWVAPAQNPDALARALAQAKTEWEAAPTLWQTRQREARERIVKHFSIVQMVAAYAAVWKA